MKDYSAIPADLKRFRQWHLWRLEDGRKIPYQINKVGKAKSNDPSTWAFFRDAIEALQGDEEGFELAFTLGERGKFVGIDFDDAFDSNGELHQWARNLFAHIKQYSYSEISPSGTGFKCLMMGQKPEGSRCSKSMGEGKQAIEVYDHNRFWAITGDVIEDNIKATSATALDNLLEESGLAAQPEAPELPAFEAPVPVVRTSSRNESKFSSAETVEYRAQKWLEKVAPPSVGERNNVLFKTSGSLLAFEGLPESKAWEFLYCFNRALPAPVTPQELSDIFESSKRNGTARASKGENRQFEAQAPQTAPVDLEALPVLLDENYIDDVPEASETLYRPSDKSEQIPVELMNDGGFIGKFMDWVSHWQAEVHPEMAFAAAVHVCSLAMSRQLHDDSVHETTPNMYSMILADSGAGKETPRKLIGKFLEECERTDLEGPAVIDSGAGLAAAIVETPSMSMLLDECGDLFANLASPRCPQHFRKVGVILKMVFSSAMRKGLRPRQLANNDAGQNNPVDYPHLHILGTATEGQVLSVISDDQIEDGLMGRFMIYFGCNDPVVQKARRADIPESLKEWFCSWRGCGGDNLALPDDLIEELNEVQFSEISRSEEAEERLEAHFAAISEKRREAVRTNKSLPEQTIWNRTAEKTAKLALMFAASRSRSLDECIIELQDADRAIAISNWMTRRIVKVYRNRSVSEYQNQRNKVLSCIGTSFITNAQLCRLCASIEPWTRNKIISDLIDSQEITEYRKGEKIMYSRGHVG